MSLLLSLLDANLALHHHAANALEKALARQQFPTRPPVDDEAYHQAYLSLREVEAQGLRLLHETALLAQVLKREEAARQSERKLSRTLQAQEKGNGKQTAILSKDELIQEEKTIAKGHQLVYQNAEEIVTICLAQHEAFARANRLFRALNHNVVLLHPRAEAAILKTYARADDSDERLRALVKAEIEQGHPLALAADLKTRRRAMRERLTALSEARRKFAAFLQQRLPMVGAL
jgi:hypothetical protein